MGLTGGVKSHRLSGQISSYCEKKRHWLCAYCAPMFEFEIMCRDERTGSGILFWDSAAYSYGLGITEYPEYWYRLPKRMQLFLF